MTRSGSMSGRGRLCALAAAVALCVGGTAQAEAPEPLRQAAIEAVASHPDVQQRWHAFLAAGNERDGARGLFLPKVDLNARGGYHRQRYPRDDFEDFSRNPRAVDVTLTQMLYDGFGVRSEVVRLSEIQRVRYFELQEASHQAALEAVRAFADVQRQRQLVDLAQENYDAHKGVYDQVVEQTESGVARAVDLEQAAGRLALAESNLLTERQNLHDVNARYYRVVGMAPPPGRVDLQGVFPEELMPATPAEALTAGITMNPGMFASLSNMEAAQQQHNVARAAYHPRVDFQVRHGWSNDMLPREDVRTIDTLAQVVLTWNLFRGGTDKARVQQYTEEFDAARYRQEEVCRNVRQTVSVAYNDIRSLTTQLRFLRQHRNSSDRVRTAYRQQFGIGQRSLLDLLDTENEYFEASRAFVNASYDLEIANARALGGMGRLLDALNIARENMPTAEELGLGPDYRIDPENVCPPEVPEMVGTRHESIFQ